MKIERNDSFKRRLIMTFSINHSRSENLNLIVLGAKQLVSTIKCKLQEGHSCVPCQFLTQNI